MSCDSKAFENGDRVVIKFDPYLTTGQPMVIGFLDNPKPCETPFVRVQTPDGVLIYNIIDKEIATGLPDSPPTFPCLFSGAVNDWLDEHVEVSAVNTTKVSDIGPVNNSYLKPSPEVDTERYHIDLEIDTSDWNDLTPGTRTRSASDEWDCPYVDSLKSHIGLGIDETYGKMNAEAEISLTITYDPSYQPPWLRTWNYYCDSFVTTIIKDAMSRVVQATGFGNRSFIACSVASGRQEDYHGFFGPQGSQYVDSTLKFYSPFKVDPMVEVEFNFENNDYSGLAIESYRVTVGCKRGATSMVGFCSLIFNYYDRSNPSYKIRPTELPAAMLYTKTELETLDNPNPFTDLSLDQNFSDAVEQLLALSPLGGIGPSITVDFVDVS